MMTELIWAAPQRWFVLIGVAIVAGAMVMRFTRLQKIMSQFAHYTRIQQLFSHFSFKSNIARGTCFVLGFAALAIGLLEPQWGMSNEQVSQAGRDVMIALDISRSMLSSDIRPSRLEQAKAKIRMLLRLLPTDRVGLLLFSADAFIVCPLTADHAAFDLFLCNVTVESYGSGTTSLSKALSTAVEAFDPVVASTKIIVLVTDGEDFSTNLTAVQKQIAQQNVAIAALGMGTEEGAPVPKLDRFGEKKGYELDGQGKPFVTRLNKTLLENITQQMQGCYVTSSYDDEDLATVARFVDSFEKTQGASRDYSGRQARYPLFFALAALALTLEWLL